MSTQALAISFVALVAILFTVRWVSPRTLALVLILPYELDYWWTIQSIAYGVVLFDLFLLAPFAPRLISLLKSQAT